MIVFRAFIDFQILGGVYPLVYSLLIRLIAWVQQAIVSFIFVTIVLFAQDAFANLGQKADFHLCQSC